MVLEIRISNFFSIKDEVVLDLRAANMKSIKAKTLKDNVTSFDNLNVLKTIMLYGANASGKSNIVKAIQFCCRMVLNSHNHNENAIFNFKKFKFNKCDRKPSNFFIRFVLNEIEYEYSFSLMHDFVVTESLFYYPNGRITKIFSRNERLGETKKEKYNFGSIIKRPLDVAESTSNKTLFVSRASQMDRSFAKDIFNYFNKTFILGYVMHNTPQTENLFNKYKGQLLEALKIADSDIVDIKIRKIKQPGKNFNANLKELTFSVEDIVQERLEIKTYHKNDTKIGFDLLSEESEGTNKLFLIMLSLLDVLTNDKILLIDEIEQSLHSDIVGYIFNLFRASKKAQLICTTHNTRFLDLKKFRKDQIYFVNKKVDSSTDLYSLYDYSDFRDTMDLEKAYLLGRFDAVPYINDSIQNLKRIIHE